MATVYIYGNTTLEVDTLRVCYGAMGTQTESDDIKEYVHANQSAWSSTACDRKISIDETGVPSIYGTILDGDDTWRMLDLSISSADTDHLVAPGRIDDKIFEGWYGVLSPTNESDSNSYKNNRIDLYGSQYTVLLTSEQTLYVNQLIDQNTGSENRLWIGKTNIPNPLPFMPQAITYIVAKYRDLHEYTITYHPDANTINDFYFTYRDAKNEGVDLTLRGVTFRRNYYTQVGWATTSGGTQEYALGGTYTEDADANLYPVWQGDAHSLTFNYNGSGASTETVQVQNGDTYGSAFPSPDPERAGYSFEGWFTKADDTGIQVSGSETMYLSDNSTTLYAHWDRTNFTVTFDPDATGASVSPASKSVIKGVAYGELPIPEWIGHRFIGWYTEPDAVGGRHITNATTFDGTLGDHTLYAHWDSITVKVTLDANGGIVSPSSGIVTVGDKYGDGEDWNNNGKLPVPTWNGMTFLGWFTLRDGGVRVEDNTIMSSTESHYLYAHWEAVKSTITFYVQDGEGAPNDIIATFGDYMPELSGFTPPTRDGLIFLGFFDSESEGVMYYTRGGISARRWDKTDDVVTLYAQWRGNGLVTILFDPNGGEIVKTGVADMGGAEVCHRHVGQPIGEMPFPQWVSPRRPVDGHYFQCPENWRKLRSYIESRPFICWRYGNVMVDAETTFNKSATLMAEWLCRLYQNIDGEHMMKRITVCDGTESSSHINIEVDGETKTIILEPNMAYLPAPVRYGYTFDGYKVNHVVSDVYKNYTVPGSTNLIEVLSVTETIEEIDDDGTTGTVIRVSGIDTAVREDEIIHINPGEFKIVKLGEDVALTAKWEPKEVNVIFKDFDGATVDELSLDFGAPYDDLPKMADKILYDSDRQTSIKYLFLGWEYTEIEDQQEGLPGDAKRIVTEHDTVQIEENHILMAVRIEEAPSGNATDQTYAVYLHGEGGYFGSFNDTRWCTMLRLYGYTQIFGNLAGDLMIPREGCELNGFYVGSDQTTGYDGSVLASNSTPQNWITSFDNRHCLHANAKWYDKTTDIQLNEKSGNDLLPDIDGYVGDFRRQADRTFTFETPVDMEHPSPVVYDPNGNYPKGNLAPEKTYHLLSVNPNFIDANATWYGFSFLYWRVVTLLAPNFPQAIDNMGEFTVPPIQIPGGFSSNKHLVLNGVWLRCEYEIFFTAVDPDTDALLEGATIPNVVSNLRVIKSYEQEKEAVEGPSALTYTTNGMIARFYSLPEIGFSVNNLVSGPNRVLELESIEGRDGDVIWSAEEGASLLPPAVTETEFDKPLAYTLRYKASQVAVSLGYVMGYGMRNGIFNVLFLDENNKYYAKDPQSSVINGMTTFGVDRYTEVKISVATKAGSRFVGWYLDREGTEPAFDTASEFILLARDNISLYAKFDIDDDDPFASACLCKWEGGTTNKLATWRSKTYVGSKPFSPVASRVDALGYAGDDSTELSLSVEMFSSPDASAKASGKVVLDNIGSQDARRLRALRPERYMQVELNTNVEVDAVLVGTSMVGIAI